MYVKYAPFDLSSTFVVQFGHIIFREGASGRETWALDLVPQGGIGPRTFCRSL